MPEAGLAQFQSLSQVVSKGLVVRMVPEYPNAFEEVKIFIGSSSLDLETAKITWKVGGQIVDQGVGAQEISVSTGDYGKETFVQAIIEDGTQIITRDFTIRPSFIDLIWQADTYTPPFYKGKALHTSEGRVTVVALPSIYYNKRKLPNSGLYFDWFLNGSKVLSGVGKDSFAFNNYFTKKDDLISVQVSLPGGTVENKKEIKFTAKEPKVILYEDDPLLGITYEKAISSEFKFKNKETSLVVSPYFFSINNPNDSELEYEWLVNNKPLVDGTRERITFRIPEGNNSGKAGIFLQLVNHSKELQFSRNTFSFVLGE